jgi:anti-sigma B factor antagonist
VVTNENASQPPQSSCQLGFDGPHLSYVDAGEQLSVVVQRLDDVVAVIHVAGEVDMVTGPLLQSHLRKALATRPERLIIDLSQVSFMGSTALSVLLSIRHAAAQQSITLQLRGTQRRTVAVPLQITGVSHMFDILSPES